MPKSSSPPPKRLHEWDESGTQNRYCSRKTLLIVGSVFVSICVTVVMSVSLFDWSSPQYDTTSTSGDKTAYSNSTNSAMQPLKVGDHIKIKISSDDGTDSDIQPHRGQEGMENLKEYIINHTNASYIAIHFASFDFDEACRMEISDLQGEQLVVMTKRGRGQLSEFWARHVNGDTMVIKVICDGFGTRADFEVDDYVAGFQGSQISIFEPNRITRRKLGGWDPFRINRSLTTCNDEDTRNAICYAQSHPTQYERARAVARLLIRGSSVCTGWLVGPNNLLMTNEHCIHSNDDALQTDYEFMYEADENADCSTPNVYDRVTGKFVFDAEELLINNEIDDFALIQLQGDPVSEFGYLELDPRIPEDGEQIYIPQHPAGQDKVLGIFDTSAPGGFCQVMNTNSGKCDNRQQYFDVSYSCDTQGGSSGSPVLSITNHKVVALHHCGGGCSGNVGVPIAEIWDQIESYYTSTGSPTPPPPTSAPSQMVCSKHEFEITLNFDHYASETSWELKDSHDNVVAEGSGFSDGSTSHYSRHCIEDGVHSLKIFDSFGDGMCCDYNGGSYLGSYEVLYDGVAVDDGNGRFANHKTISVPQTTAPTSSPFIVGSDNDACTGHVLKVVIMTDQFASETYWKIFDSNGAEVYQGGSQYNNNQMHEETHCLETGVHTFTIYDLLRDGFCCDFGQGYFELWYDGTKVVDRDGNIGAEFSVTLGEETLTIDTNATAATVSSSNQESVVNGTSGSNETINATGPTASPSISTSNLGQASVSSSAAQNSAANNNLTPVPSSLPSASSAPSLDNVSKRAYLESLLSTLGPFTVGSSKEAMDWLVDQDTWRPSFRATNGETLWRERYILAQFYFDTGGSSWYINTDWLSSKSVCDWYMHKSASTPVCNNGNNEVTRFGFVRNNLVGSISSSIGQLANLDWIQLNGDNSAAGARLNGIIPTEIGNLSLLTRLDLHQNSLRGTIPTELADLSQLTLLALNNNHLTGLVPPMPSNLSVCMLAHNAQKKNLREYNCFSDWQTNANNCEVWGNCVEKDKNPSRRRL